MGGVTDETHRVSMALSANPAVVRELSNKRFQERCPAFGLGNLLNGFGLDKSNLNLQSSAAYATLAKKKAAANWAANLLEASVHGGLEPDFVQLTYNSIKDDERIADGSYIGDTLFRVDFKKINAVTVGRHSVVFGFTSDLPPTDEPIRVEGKTAAAGTGQTPAVAVGIAPTPVGVSEAAAPMISGMIGGGNLGGGAVGGGAFPLPGALFGAAAAPVGFGSVGATGNTQPAQTQAQNQNQNQAQSQQQTPNTTINFNATLSNQQSQQQTQQQQQQQQQQQSQSQTNNNTPGQVVPAPPALILGLLGMPAFYFFRRGNKKKV
jgi:hypothetical protein